MKAGGVEPGYLRKEAGAVAEFLKKLVDGGLRWFLVFLGGLILCAAMIFFEFWFGIIERGFGNLFLAIVLVAFTVIVVGSTLVDRRN